MTPTICQLKAAVESLGPTTESALARLRETGTRGRRRSCGHCPVANYIIARVWPALVPASLAYVKAGVCQNHCGVYWMRKEASGRDRGRVEIPTPAHIVRLIMEIDDGAHPDLLE